MQKIKTLIKKLKTHFNKGMSLTETIIWVAIVSVFAGIIGFAGMKYLQNAKVHAAVQEMKIYKAALLEYYSVEGSYPDDSQGLNALLEGGYISLPDSNENSGELTDPWKNPYIYTQTDSGEGYVLKSLGSDKKEGGTSRNAKDIIVSTGNTNEGGDFMPGEVN